MEQTKRCPSCNAEYYASAQNCADCEIQLEWSHTKPDRKPGSTPMELAGWDDISPGVILGEITSDHERVIGVYLAYFKTEGIMAATLPRTRYSSRELQMTQSVIFGNTLTGGKGGQIPDGDVLEGFAYHLFVQQSDYERADQIIEEHFAELHPGQEEGFYREFDLGSCPACGYAVADGADICGDCGLGL